MRATLIKIGNSQGVRLPKAVVEQAGLGKELELEVRDGTVVIRAARATRAGWAKAAEACHQAGDDVLADWDAVTDDFEGEWE